MDPKSWTGPLIESDKLSERGTDEKEEKKSYGSVQSESSVRSYERGKDVSGVGTALRGSREPDFQLGEG